MVLRTDAVRERLLKLEEVISRLEDLGRVDAATLRLNFRDAWTVERGLQLGAEAIFEDRQPHPERPLRRQLEGL